MKESLLLYFKHYVDFHSRTSRYHYWWALGSIYVFTVIAGTISAMIGFPFLMPIWLAVNVIPLLSLTCRRLRDVGLTNKAIITGAILYILLFGLFALQPNSAVAFGLEILSIIIVLLPLLKTNELASSSQSPVIHFFVQPKTK